MSLLIHQLQKVLATPRPLPQGDVIPFPSDKKKRGLGYRVFPATFPSGNLLRGAGNARVSPYVTFKNIPEWFNFEI